MPDNTPKRVHLALPLHGMVYTAWHGTCRTQNCLAGGHARPVRRLNVHLCVSVDPGVVSAWRAHSPRDDLRMLHGGLDGWVCDCGALAVEQFEIQSGAVHAARVWNIGAVSFRQRHIGFV